MVIPSSITHAAHPLNLCLDLLIQAIQAKDEATDCGTSADGCKDLKDNTGPSVFVFVLFLVKPGETLQWFNPPERWTNDFGF